MPSELEFWDKDHPVLRLLRERRDSGSTPGHRDPLDTARVGLAVEGGGMRGVVSAAMLVCLEDRGLLNGFDAVYGVSSGAINAAYFLTGNTWYPGSIYYDDLTTRKFISYWRVLAGRSMLNLDFAYKTVIGKIKPLDYDKVLASPAKLTIGITLVDELSALAATDFTSASDLNEALMASAWLPLAVRGTGVYRGKRALDGGVLIPLPYRLAVDDGCTHILSLGTKPMPSPRRIRLRSAAEPPAERRSPARRTPAELASGYTAWHLDRIREGLGNAYLESRRLKGQDRRSFAEWRLATGGDPPFILDIAPLPGTPQVGRTEMSPNRLLAAARNAYATMYAAIEGKSARSLLSGQIQVVPRLTLVDRAQEAAS
jgi:predicted acylesterase/phospholipase RssA